MAERSTTTKITLPAKVKQLTHDDEQYILKKIESYCKTWSMLSDWLNAGIIFLGITAIVTSVLVSIYTGSTTIPAESLKILACISTIALGILTAFNMVGRSNDSRTAWRIINSSLMLYRAGRLSIEQLIEQYQKGETRLGLIDFNYGANGTQTNQNNDDMETSGTTINTKVASDEQIAETAVVNQIIEEEHSTEKVLDPITNATTTIEKNSTTVEVKTGDANIINERKID